MSSRDEQIGEAVRELRGEMSQDALAESMRVSGHPKWSQSTVWSVERGTRPLRLTEAETIAELFRHPLDELLAPADMRLITHHRRQVGERGLRLAFAALDMKAAQEGLMRALEKAGRDLDDPDLDFQPHEKARATLTPDQVAAAALAEDGGAVGLRFKLGDDDEIVVGPATH